MGGGEGWKGPGVNESLEENLENNFRLALEYDFAESLEFCTLELYGGCKNLISEPAYGEDLLV